MSAAIQACVFDAYGTLFDVHSAVARHAAAVGPAADALSRNWRLKQLEYSWTRSLMRRHADFWTVTGEALDAAMATVGLTAPRLREQLLQSYLALDAYPEVPVVLDRLAGAGMRNAILSNGSPAMLQAAVQSAGLAGRLELVISVEDAGIFKPDPRVYRLAVDRLGVPAERISFLSSNVWDAAGAAAFGFQAVWVNRGGQPAEYGWALQNARQVASLEALPELLIAS